MNLDSLNGPIVPGHPLYAQVQAKRMMAEALDEAVEDYDVDVLPSVHNMRRKSEHVADSIIARLANHDPPILFGTPDEFKGHPS